MSRCVAWAAVLLSVVVSACAHTGTRTISRLFEHQTAKTTAALNAYANTHVTQPVVMLTDIAVAGEAQPRIDILYPQAAVQTGRKLPVMVWVHGGAWIAGSKDDARPYLALYANQGMAVVNVDYTLAPQASHPQQLHELNQALAYVLQHVEKWPLDTRQMFLAGDSAGANLVSTYVAAISNRDLQQRLGLQPVLQHGQVQGLLLHSGVFDMQALYAARAHTPKPIAWSVGKVVAAISGENPPQQQTLKNMSAIPWLTPDYPPVYVSASANDSLTASQTEPFITALRAQGVPVQAQIYPKTHAEKLQHVFHFNMAFDASQTVLPQSLDFMQQHSQSISGL